MKTYIKQLSKLGACPEALEWAENNCDSLEDAWAKCERGDWMLWLADKLSGEPGSEARKKLVLATCQCVRLALPYVAKGELRPLRAIETAERWAKGDISLVDVRAAAYAAYAATNAANAANAATNAAANAAVYAVTQTKGEILKQCADIVRRYYPEAPKLPGRARKEAA